MTSPRRTAVVLTTRWLLQDFCQHGCRQRAAPHVFVHECEQAVCQRPPLRSEWWWGKLLGRKAFIICYILYVCPSQEKAFLMDVWSLGCLSFQGSQGVSVHWHSHWLVSMGMGTLPWQQDLDRYATKWDKPFQRGCIILVPTINWNFRDMQTLYCSWN